MDDTKLAMLGNGEAAKRLMEDGVLPGQIGLFDDVEGAAYEAR